MSKSSNNKIVRVYTGGDAAMLTSLAVLMGVASQPTIKTFLLSKRSNWNAAFLKSLTDAIDAAFKDVLGVDNKKKQTTASKEFYAAMEAVLPKLRSFKSQVEVDFEDDNREAAILSSLGFDLWKKVNNDNQQALTELLAKFSKNMDATLEGELVAAGIDASYITDIISYADIIKNKNIAQEESKKDKKTITADGITQLNKVYSDVMKVAKIATSLYEEIKDNVTAEKFSYTRTLNTLSVSRKKEKVDTKKVEPKG